MKIAVFSDSFYPQVNGVVTAIHTLAEALAKKGHEFKIFAPYAKGTTPKMHHNISVVHATSLPFPFYPEYKMSLPYSIRTRKQFKDFNPDIVHVHTPFAMGWRGLALAKEFKVPVIGTYNTLLPEFMMYSPFPKSHPATKAFIWKYSNAFYNQCLLVTTPSKAMRNELMKNKLKSKSLTVPWSIDLTRFKRVKKPKLAKQLTQFSTVFMYTGRVSFEKNIDILLQGFILLLKKRKKKDLALIIVGDGPALPVLKAIAEENNLSKNILFTGYLKGKDLIDALSSADIYTTASTIETQGLAVIEAMAIGMPVIASNYLALPEAVHDGKNGYLFKPLNPQDFAVQAEKLLASKAKQKTFAKQSKTIAKTYSLNKMVAIFEKLYKQYGKH